MNNLDSKHKLFILEHQFDNIRDLALQGSRYKDIDMLLVLKQIEGLQIAKKKIPSWSKLDILYPIHLSLEQCSSEYTALYKSTLSKGNILIDLTGGFGVDFAFMATKFNKAYYIEQQSELAEIAKHNFKEIGLNNVTVINSEASIYLENLKEKVSTIFIDPARRDQAGSKTVFINDCTPNVIDLDSTLNEKAEKTIIKLSPMLDISQALSSISNITDIHIVSVNNECKELLFIKRKETKRVEIHCVNIVPDHPDDTDIFTYTKDDEQYIENTLYANEINTYLYEPNSSILKAGAYKIVAKRYNLVKLNVNSHLYTSDEYKEHFPGRVFNIEQIYTFSKKDILQLQKSTPKANITVRNFPLSVNEIRKQTKIKEGGDKYIFATTLYNEKKVLVLCNKIKFK